MLTKRVILYGNTIFMAGVETCLRSLPGLTVYGVDATLPDAREHLARLVPDVVIFEWATPPAQDLLELSREHPGLILISLGLDEPKVTVFSSQRHAVQTANELAQIIRTLPGH
jgi:hypothetical protein